MPEVLSAILVSLAVVFVAELGDKSQLMALTFATRYRAFPVLVGISIATSVVHLVSVAVGFGLGTALPTTWITTVAAVAFLGFAVWAVRGDSMSEEEQGKAGRGVRSAVVSAAVAFFLAELGDKTMLATVMLATQHGWFGVWVGSTVGMVAADALAILVGRQLAKRLSADVIRYGAAALFAAFGLVLLSQAIGDLASWSVWHLLTDMLDHHLGAWIAIGLAVVAVALVVLGRRWAHVGRDRTNMDAAIGSAVWWSRLTFTLAVTSGGVGAVLVATGLGPPVAVLNSAAFVVGGAGLLLVGLLIIASAVLQMGVADRRGGTPMLDPSGPYARVRQPVVSGAVLVSIGVVAMAPTMWGALGTALLVVAAQIESRLVREPSLFRSRGQSYAHYRARTGHFVPRIRTARGSGPTLGGTGRC